MKLLAQDICTFSLMIEGGFIYVDKTELIHKLYASGSRYHFLSRPRRFGKTLLISTLKSLFLGHRDLFKGLWIETSNFPFTQHPVIHFDFSTFAHRTPDDLEISLHENINAAGALYGIDVTGKITYEDKITFLVKKLAEINPVVLLIDEYDHPVLKHIQNPQNAEATQKILKGFYEAVKGLDPYFRAIFITGVTKFAKTSLFSGLNNLHDISESPHFANILGYTEDEVKHNFNEAIAAFAHERKVPIEDLIAEMRHWYNGYRFSRGNIKVYNPFSVIYYLTERKLANYWFSSGNPSFLIESLKKNPTVLNDFESNLIESSIFEPFDVGNVPTITLMYQAGYLTIKKYEVQFDTDTYTLGHPNEEVKRSLSMLMLGVLTAHEKPLIESALFKLRMALGKNDMETFCKVLQELFAQIPYQLHSTTEAYYHSLLQFLLYLLGFDATSEISTHNGRIDLVIVTNLRIYLFEFKFNQPKEKALNQILERNYFTKYQNSSKEITLVGMSFNVKDKKIIIEFIQKDFRG